MKKAKFMLLPLLLMVVAMFFGCENTADNHSGATNLSSSVPLSAPRNVKVVYRHANSAEIAFDDVPGASSYTICWDPYDSRSERTERITRQDKHSEASPYNLRGLSPYTHYRIKVKAIGSDGNSSYSKEVEFYTKIAAPRVSLIKKTSTSITVQWTIVDGGMSYEIFYGTTQYIEDAKKLDTYSVSSPVVGTTVQTDISSLTRGKTWYVFVKPVDYLNIYGVEYGKNSIQL
ncbi:MAG: fibronectin type III domain-containing protein [Treponema sp.]|nr:fibronectin type III domain-containing protein [Treponema sp.]